MNQRIKQLYEQAMEQHVSNNMAWEELNPEKFAELIVRECARAADEGMAQVTMRVEWPSYHIKKHFGVEQ
jgi:hypothetical protein